MPAIPKGSKVLVTGANGYIAMWVVRYLLEKGYKVRATVRTTNRIKYIKDYFAELGYMEDRLEIIVVDSITKEGAFDEAVKGIDAVEHTASPFHFNAKDPQELIGPAVQGTVGILKSILKNGTNVKRIIVTSSTASIEMIYPHPCTFTDKDWNTQAPKDVEELGINTPSTAIYRASKTLAEKAAWDFHKKVKAEVQWDLSTINPTYVFGPPVHDIKSLLALNTSLGLWYNNLYPKAPKTKDEILEPYTWVDVRDAAMAHVLALEKEDAGGERFITCAGTCTWQDWYDALNEISPNPFPSHEAQKGIPGLRYDKEFPLDFDTSKAERILGIKWHTFVDATRDTLLEFSKRGW